ncbi:FG-GAP-like repeat-containing protein [Arthrobacter sp. ok362]|uniref:FG-GAP-like repeat-containing protein n=1 Tax=Arthrobacter sp. ok362 TaxID=1761745 RepID=UPI000885083D|nr:FG-GAP-like repeat-containing protein [Arthrobacter sp. ok362]SDL96636.1 Outer membrane protein assembly factor BamB, contains PQQ-like beta-propeller repeat [Arthrobacter sp. ok362]
MAVSLGAGVVLSSATTTAAMAATPATAPANSLESLNGTDVVLTTVGTEPSAVVNRYKNVFSSVPDPSAVFFRNKVGVLKLAAGCHGLVEQVQVFDVATGKREMSATPFPEGGGGAGNVSYEPVSNSILAFGATVKKVSLTGTVTNGFAAAAGTTNVSFARATDSKNRVWCGNYPAGSATRFDPATGATIHTPRVHADAQYVRSLAVDARDNVYAGTGAQNPRIVTWHTDSPTILREIALPSAVAKGFVRSISAHSGWLFVYFDGADGTLTFKAYDIAAGAWKTLPWAWAPAGRVSAGLGASGDIYAVWNTVGTHKLMKINPKTMAAETVCLVPDTPRALNVETINGATSVNLLCGDGKNNKYVKVSVAGKVITQTVPIAFATSPFQIQTLLPAASGTVMYLGAFMGDGIGSVDLGTRATWRSPTETGIAQIEGMFQYDATSIYVGSYGGGRLFRFNPQTKSVTSLIELCEKYLQSRPFAWARAGGRVVAGTVAEYGHNTGALVSINPLNNSDISVVSGPVLGQSVLGLVGEGDIVYGTTGIKGGYGSANDTKPAHVFAWNARLKQLVWKRALTGEVEVNSPILVSGVLYVSTNNGVIRLNKSSGSVVSAYKLLNRAAPAGYKTSSISYLPSVRSILHEAGGTVTVLDMESRTKKEILRGSYSNMVVSSKGKLYLAENGTDVVEVSTVQKPSIRSAADLVTVGTDGWLYVARSLGGGKFAPPMRADSGFGTYVRSCHVADWNGDGILDVITSHGDGTLQVHKGLPEGGFAPGIVVGVSGWLDRKMAIGKWGSTLSVVASENISGALQAWPVLSTGKLGTPVAIGSGWKRKQMVMLVPSRSTAAALIVNDNGSLYRYARTSTGKVSTTPVRLSTGGYTGMTAFSPVIGHRTGFNGVVGIDLAGGVKYGDVASSSVGTPVSYPFLMKGYKFASS